MAARMPLLFRSIVLLLTGLALCAASQPDVPVAQSPTTRDQHDLRCAAAFAVVATLQARGDKSATALPPLGIRGKHYLGLVGERLAAERGLTGEAVRDLLTAAARNVAHDGAAGVAQACLADLDAIVPQHPAPDAPACLALLDVYAQVLTTRDPDDPLAARLRQESAGLAATAQALLASKGLDAAAQAAVLDRERARVRQALTGGPATRDADDFAQCRQLASARPR
jgi:hypothetical protein